jgi:hypothetical protein
MVRAGWIFVLLIVVSINCTAQRFPLLINSIKVYDNKEKKTIGELTYSNKVLWLTIDSVMLFFRVTYTEQKNNATLLVFENDTYEGFMFVNESPDLFTNTSTYYIVSVFRDRNYLSKELLVRFKTKNQRR